MTLLDLGLPPRPNEPEEGLAVLSAVLALDPLAKVIVVSGQGDKQNALRAVGAGAYDFLCKPVDMDELRLVLQRCVYVAELEQEYRAMQHERAGRGFEDMLGASPQMQAVFDFIRKVATTSAPVLILGESGTGKEMVAQALHRRSAQSGGPFVAINCNAIPENLLESELFGHEKGAFTGAHTQRKGHIETGRGRHALPRRDRRTAGAGAGEAAALPPGEALPARRRPAGDSERRARDCGHEPEPAGIGGRAGSSGRTCTFAWPWSSSRCPPLRERGDDVVLVAKAFLHSYGVEHGKPGLTFAPDALRALSLHRWPGNVRELQNRVQRAVIMADGKRVTARDLELTDALSALPPQTLKEARESVEREMVQDALRRHRGKITAAALELGISRPTLYELMEKLGIARVS